MEGQKNSVDSFKKDICILFDEICDIIIEEKGQVSEDEIQQLVEMLRNKVKKKQVIYKGNLKLKKNDKSEELKFNNALTVMSDLENANLGKTSKALEDITDKMSDYIIQEKGEIIEQDIVEIANQFRQFSSVTITENTCPSSSQLLCKSDSEKTESSSPKRPNSSSIGNIEFKKFIESNKTINSSFYSCVSLCNEPPKDNIDGELNEKVNVDSVEKNFKTNARNSAKLSRNVKSKERVNGKFNRKQSEEHKNISKNQKQLLSHPKKPVSANNVPDVTNNEVVNFDRASKTEEHSDLPRLSTDHRQDLSQNERKARSKWKLGKNDEIVFKTTNFVDLVISTERKPNPQQETMVDASDRLAVLFSNVIDVILEKFNIRGEDVEKIANLMLQYEKETAHNSPINEFVSITPDIPRWALRGFLNTTSNGLTNVKLVSSFLNKVAEYVVHQNGQIFQTDRTNFCAIFGKKLLHQIYPKDIKNHLGIPQKNKMNLKIKKSELQISSEKFCETVSPRQNTEQGRGKRTFTPCKKENLPSGGLMKNLKANDTKQTLSIDDAIEEGIRSLEYIKQLSERLLSDFDDNNPELKNDNVKKRSIQLRISQNKSLPFQTNLEYNKGKRKGNFNEGKHQYCTNFKENYHKIKVQSRNCSLRSTTGDQKVDVVKINKSKVFKSGYTSYHKTEQVNRIVKIQSKRIQSNNEHYGGNELQPLNKKISQTTRSNRNNSAPLLRSQTDVKRYIKTSRAICRSLEVNNFSRLINQKIKSDLENDIVKKKEACRKYNENNDDNNNEQKKEEPLERITNQFDSFSGTRNEEKPKKSISQEVILKVSRTYSVFKPLLSDIKNNMKAANTGYKPYQPNRNRYLKRTENITNFVKEKYFNSKIPIRTFYLSKGMPCNEK